MSSVFPSRHEIKWDGQFPESRLYGDLFYSRLDGLDETREVFLEANQLKERFSNSDQFVIGEVGFGFGLNFLATALLFNEVAVSGSRLVYISFEKNPIDVGDLKKALSSWPELKQLQERLFALYPGRIPGSHRLHITDQIDLQIIVGDVRDTLPRLRGHADAWFLDGFAPSKNAGAWDPGLFKHLYKKTQPGGTFATYAAAGHVRRALLAAGFEVERRPGYKGKRERLVGRKSGMSHSINRCTPQVAVVGAGVAGCATAYSLLRRGARVTLFDQSGGLCHAASGNPLAIMMPYLNVPVDLRAEVNLSGFLYTLRLLSDFSKSCKEIRWSSQGVIRLPLIKRVEKLLESFDELDAPDSFLQRLSSDQTKEITNGVLNTKALSFPQSGCFNIKALCERLLDVYQERISFCPSGLTTSDKADEYSAIVFAPGAEWKAIEELKWLPFGRLRGQVVSFKSDDLEVSDGTPVLCGDGYLAFSQGEFVAGASFDRGSENVAVDHQIEEALLQKISTWIPSLKPESITDRKGRVAFRCTSPDRLPAVGLMPDRDVFERDYKTQSYEEMDITFSESFWKKDVYINAGHGSHGTITAPISGEEIASLIFDEPAVFDTGVGKALSPLRFLVRELNRR